MTQTTDWEQALKPLHVRYSTWQGNVNEKGIDAEFVTDTKLLYRASVADSKRHEKLASETNVPAFSHRPQFHTPEQCEKVWKQELRPQRSLHLTALRTNGRSKHEKRYAFVSDGDGLHIALNADHLKILQLVVGFDEIRGDEQHRSVILYKEGEPVALSMPYRYEIAKEKAQEEINE